MKSFTNLSATLALAVALAIALPGASARAADGPAATTGPPSAITANSAVVSATVQPNGTTTSYYFEYGTSTQYGNQTSSTTLDATTGSIPVQATLSGLTSDTTYHFRVVATSTAGTAFGGDTTFTTAKSPPAVGAATATGVNASSATLDATVDAGGEATSYVFQYGPTASYGQQTAATSAGSGTAATAVHMTVTGLVSGTTYHFRILATNADGSAATADAVFTTAKLPPSVSVGRPSFVNSSSADLTGTVDPNGKAATYVVEYGPTPSYGLQTATAAVGAGASAVAVHSALGELKSGTVYHYRFVAINADGTTASADGTFETTGNRVVVAGPLPTVSGAAAVRLTAHSVQLNGAVNPQGPTTTWYFEVGLTAAYGLQTRVADISGLGARAINAQLSGLESDATYHYRLVAYSANGLYVGPDHTFTTRPGTRLNTRGIIVDGSTLTRPGLLAIRIHGRLRLASHVSAAAACNGVVALTVMRGGETIELRHANLRSNCTYAVRLHVPYGRLHGSSRLTVTAYYWGNAVLMPTKARRTVWTRT